MIIGITMRGGLASVDGSIAEMKDTISRDWIDYLHAIFPQAQILPIPNHPRLAIQLAKKCKINRMIFSNGADWGKDPERDVTEKKLFAHCIAHAIPLLGVCRGFQVLNVLCGGTIEQNINSASGENHGGTRHRIEIIDSPQRRIAKTDSLSVNSFHRQGVTEATRANALTVFARTRGGAIEGLYHPRRQVLGIQWHPERKSPSKVFDRKLITHFFSP